MVFQISEREYRDDQEDFIRLVIAEDNTLVYANEYFLDTFGFDGIAALPKAGNLFRLKNKKSLKSIEAGCYAVKFIGRDETAELYFTRVKSQDGQSFLVATQDAQEAEEDSKNKLESLLIKGRSYANSALEAEKTPALTLPESLRIQNMGSLEADTDLRRFLDMSHDVMLVIDRHGTIVRTNRTFRKVFGFYDYELENMTFFSLFSDEDKPTIRSTMHKLLMHDDHVSVVDFESVMLTKSGSTRYMEWRQSYLDNYIYCVGRDVTAVKLHEQELETRENQLCEAEIIGRMGRWRWVIGQDEIEWSEQIYRIFGIKRGEFTPTIDTLNRTVHRRDVGRVVQAFQRAIIEENDYDMEFRITRPGGDTRYIRCEGRCERDEDGDVIALYGIMQDMTERMLYERELKEAKDAAERAYAAKSQFLANMSHELRTPLNAIIGFSEMMQRQLLGPIGTEKYLDYIAGIRESGEHLLDLISDILDMSKIEAGKHEMDWEEINIVKIIRLAAHMMEGRALDANVKLSLAGLEEHEDLVVVADRRAFMQVMLNIMSNAVKFSKETGKVWVECFVRPSFVSIKIHDNGVGIPANKLQSITQPFEQASSSYDRAYEGSGLGLAITKELVEMHHGSLLIDSTLDEGTTVTVRLPYDPTKL